ncbi:MAG: HAD-IC family P-type ATPase [Chitinophagaceae bacterium]|nr:HAD-IC family P-type ATPase [Chitinophagaceae bacterium]
MTNPSNTWYQVTAEEVQRHFAVPPDGLTKDEVVKRQQQYGLNVIPQPKGKSLAAIFFSQFLNPLIYVLIGAAIVSLISGDVKDAIFIFAIIVINAILGTYQEWRAENSAAALRNLVKVQCRVKRGGKIYQVEAEDLVPGDLVFLESGFKVPADLRLIEVHDLTIEEALLTGESVAVSKLTTPVAGEHVALGDQLNMAFAATTVQKGRGWGIVAETGKKTEIGKIADSLSVTEDEKPPLIRRMDAFSKKISIAVLVICLLLGVIGWLEGIPLKEIFFLMVAVGVSAIPEGLPIALTVALSIGTRRMARRNVIVRKLPAVEGLGSCTLIASDKTGTLTMDQQSVKKISLPGERAYFVTGQGYNGEGEITDEAERTVTDLDEPMFDFIQGCILCNEGILRKTDNGWEHSGDAVDVALRAIAYKAGKNPAYFKEGAEVVEMVPYESENKFSAVYFRYKGQLRFVMKGAVEVVAKGLTHGTDKQVHEESEQMAAEGYRVIALAAAVVEDTSIENLPALDLLGLVGLIDPLRPEAVEAVKGCRQAGIRVVMVTGDHPATALAIAKNLGLAQDGKSIITGAELASLEKVSADHIALRIKDKNVFARVTPLQKQKIVEVMKGDRNFVAVTGDGANDAPALKSAHIGVAMGSGTDLAKEASSIIVTDNNFASIAAGVEEGRFTYDNLRKIIYLLISTGAAEILTVALALFTNMPLPFLAVQLLWLNLVTNGIQDIALAFEKGDPEAMKKPPRDPEENIFDRLMNLQIVVSGIVISAVVFVTWYHLLNNLNYDEKHARTVVMMLMVLLQNFHVLNCRSETKSLFKIPLKNNYVLLAGIIVAQSVHISASYIPGLSDTLHLEPLTFNEWLFLIPDAAIILIVMEIFKWWWRRKYKLNKIQPAVL